MKNRYEEIRQAILDGNTGSAIAELEKLLQEAPSDEGFYLLGNAYRKLGDWQKALNNYQEAIALNPDSPAVSARQMALDILNFYNKDMFNQ